MKITRNLQIVITLVLSLWQVTAHSQTYFYSGPLNGNSYIEVDLTPAGVGRSGGLGRGFGTLTETLYYDPVHQTLRQVGSVTVNPASAFSIISDWAYNPVGTETLTVGNNGSFSFDRISLVGLDAAPSYGIYVPVTGSGIYNGQAFAGSWNVYIPMNPPQIIAVDSTSLTFSETSQGGGFDGFGAIRSQIVIPGTDLEDGISDHFYYYRWRLDSAVAMAVPEPGLASVFSLGVFVMALFRRCSKRS